MRDGKPVPYDTTSLRAESSCGASGSFCRLGGCFICTNPQPEQAARSGWGFHIPWYPPRHLPGQLWFFVYSALKRMRSLLTPC